MRKITVQTFSPKNGQNRACVLLLKFLFENKVTAKTSLLPQYKSVFKAAFNQKNMYQGMTKSVDLFLYNSYVKKLLQICSYIRIIRIFRV